VDGEAVRVLNAEKDEVQGLPPQGGVSLATFRTNFGHGADPYTAES
jgi:hypothetical protein